MINVLIFGANGSIGNCIYNNFNDTLKFKAIVNKLEKITDIQNQELPDSIKYDLITLKHTFYPLKVISLAY